MLFVFFFFKQKTAYEVRISDWSSDVCSSDLKALRRKYRSPCPMAEEPPVILVLNGPNLNLLGLREPEIYGHDTLDDIAGRLEDRARELGVSVDCRQSNHEGHLIDWLHEANARGAKAVILNPGGYTHTSVAIGRAIKSITVPVIAVHLSRSEERRVGKECVSKCRSGGSPDN